MGLYRWRDLPGSARRYRRGSQGALGSDRVEIPVSAKDSWVGATANLGSIGALYNLTMDPYEKYDMIFNGAAPTRTLSSSPGKYAGEDNGWVLSLIYPVIIDFDKSIIKYPSITRYVGGASNDLVPNLQRPDNPVPLLKDQINRL